MSSCAVVRARGQHDDDAEVVGRRLAELGREHVDDLGRPEELALEVHEPPRGAQRAHVGLEDPEVAVADEVVLALGDRADDLDLGVARGLDGRGAARRAAPP